MADSSNPVDINISAEAFQAAWAEYLVTKQNKRARDVSTWGATRHLAQVQNFVENYIISSHKKLSGLVLNAAEFGAVADGETDSADAINAAIAAASAAGGGKVILPPGDIVIGASVGLLDYVHLEGAGPGATTLLFDVAGFAVVLDDISDASVSNLTIEFGSTASGGVGLSDAMQCSVSAVDVYPTSGPAGVGISLSNCVDCRVLWCSLVSCTTGVAIGPADTTRTIVIGSTASVCSTGFLVLQASNNTIDMCTTDSCTNGITVQGNSSGDSNNNMIRGCVFTNNVTRNLNIVNSHVINATVIGCRFLTAGSSADNNSGTTTYMFGNTPTTNTFGAALQAAGQLLLGGATGTGAILADGNSGNVIVSDTGSNETTKQHRIMTRAYVNAQSPFVAMYNTSATSANTVNIGGGTGLGQAATTINFFTASAVNTTTGTNRWTILSDSTFRPVTTLASDIGTNSFRVRRLATGMIARGVRVLANDATANIAVTDGYLFLSTTTGTKAVAFPYGPISGDELWFRCISASGGSYTIACTLNATAGTLTLDAAGEYAHIVYDGSVWRVVDFDGATFA
jgi:hypothetical protein